MITQTIRLTTRQESLSVSRGIKGMKVYIDNMEMRGCTSEEQIELNIEVVLLPRIGETGPTIDDVRRLNPRLEKFIGDYFNEQQATRNTTGSALPASASGLRPAT